MKLKLSQIKRDGNTQARLNLNHEAVEDYSAAMREGALFPPVVVFHDGKDYWLADGFHRCAAADYAGIDIIEADIRTGGRREALRYALGANKRHGVRPTREDKRHAVNLALDDETLCGLSNRELADEIGVSEGFIRKVKRNRCVYTQGAHDGDGDMRVYTRMSPSPSCAPCVYTHRLRFTFRIKPSETPISSASSRFDRPQSVSSSKARLTAWRLSSRVGLTPCRLLAPSAYRKASRRPPVLISASMMSIPA